jgi:gliding motility-associated lipoprotein GldD
MSIEGRNHPPRRKLPWVWMAGLLALVGGVYLWTRPAPLPVPKPLGHVRIALPDTSSTPYVSPCGTGYNLPNHAKVELRATPEGAQGCWYNLTFPRFKAKVHCTEVPVGNRLSELMNDAQDLVFGHEVAATGIRRYALNESGKSGMLYVLEGPVAAPLQFFVTDSSEHFMRGSLYFAHQPNPDSTAPVLERMEADMRRLMETLSWP